MSMSSRDPLRVAVVSLGCPKALIDTEKMLAMLAEAGGVLEGPGGQAGASSRPCLVGAPMEEADVILINTCAFIRAAREESMRAIRQAVARKRAGPVRRVVVAGCLPQREAEGLLSAEPGIDALIGVFNRQDVVPAVTSEQTPFVRVGQVGTKRYPDDRGRLRLTARHTAYLRLGEGCSATCSFCTIPAIRGPARSKPMQLVLEEAAELIADGAVEINLIAQDTTAYGNDLGNRTSLGELLRRLDGMEGLRWLRLMYANPATLGDQVVEALAECPRIVKYLDLPLQHVCDKTLRLMRRGYDRQRVERLVETLRRRVPGIALRTTFIVGFPRERAEDFKELLEFVKATRFDALGVFTYCPEAGTIAAGMRGQVPEKTKLRRRDRLMRAQQAVAFAAADARVGSRLEVLVDGVDSRARCVGRHAGQAPEVDGVCLLTGPAEAEDPAQGTWLPPQAGRIVQGTVVGRDGYDLIVEVENAEPHRPQE